MLNRDGIAPPKSEFCSGSFHSRRIRDVCAMSAIHPIATKSQPVGLSLEVRPACAP